ncbi:histidine phosphatase family protein [Candidatus Woesearchaeota archaeon]|nr:histidine phosphatase family protein [Candidatus Woesearchaeota archaeon]
MLDLYLIRHAESEANNNPHLISGRSNEIPLSEVGKYQAELLGKRFKDHKIIFDRWYSSTAVRTVETARISGKVVEHSIDEVLKSPELLELDMGEWVGRLRTEAYTPEVLSKINSDNWNFAPPGGESQREVEERMLRWVNGTLLKKYQHEQEKEQEIKMAVFTHGLAIKCLLRGIMDFSTNITYRIHIDNTSITRLNYDKNGWHVITVNDTSHFKW